MRSRRTKQSAVSSQQSAKQFAICNRLDHSSRYSVLLSLAAGCWLLAASCSGQDDLVARRERIQNLSPSEQQQLLRNQERFDELPADEQKRLRKLHEELSRDANGEKLRSLLERYRDWLETLSPEQRAELAELGPDKRVERIGQLMVRQRVEQEGRRPRPIASGPPLPPEDLRAVFRWFNDYVWEHREKTLARMPPRRREEIERLDEPAQRRRLMFATTQLWRNGPPAIESADLERLIKSLSPETQDKFANADAQQQRWLAKNLLFQAVTARMESASMRRSLAMVSSEDLERFFQEELPQQDRQRLMNLPPDRMREELRHLYLEHTRRPEGPPRDRPHRPPHDRPEGLPFGPPDELDFRRPPNERMDRPKFDHPDHPSEFRGPKRPPTERGRMKKEREPGNPVPNDAR
jgi:hypothetical protein